MPKKIAMIGAEVSYSQDADERHHGYPRAGR
jgi:hypothetical protein